MPHWWFIEKKTQYQSDLQQYIEEAKYALECSNDPDDVDSIFLHAEIINSIAMVYFFRTTKTDVFFIQINVFMDYSTSWSSNFLLKGDIPLDYVGPEYFPFLKEFSNYLRDHTKHENHCKQDDIFCISILIGLLDHNQSKKSLHCTCDVPLCIEFTPNLNQKTIEIWSLWALADSYIEWIPEEVLLEILLLL
jgi:hypothetical protein